MEARENAIAREEIAQQLAKKAKKSSEKGVKTEKRRKMNSGGSDAGSPKRKASSDSDSEMDAAFHRPSDVSLFFYFSNKNFYSRLTANIKRRMLWML